MSAEALALLEKLQDRTDASQSTVIEMALRALADLAPLPNEWPDPQAARLVALWKQLGERDRALVMEMMKAMEQRPE